MGSTVSLLHVLNWKKSVVDEVEKKYLAVSQDSIKSSLFTYGMNKCCSTHSQSSVYEKMILSKGGVVGRDEVVDVLIGVCEGLYQIHACGGVHKDLRWENVLYRKNSSGRVVPEIIGFGQKVLTQEMKKRKRVDAKTNVFSFGIMMYQLIFKKTREDLMKTFPERIRKQDGKNNRSVNITSIIAEVGCYHYPKIEDDQDTVTKEFVRIMRNCYDYNPRVRMQFSEIREALETAKGVYEKLKQQMSNLETDEDEITEEVETLTDDNSAKDSPESF